MMECAKGIGLIIATGLGIMIAANALAAEGDAAALAKPTAEQLAWQDCEIGVLICLDLITFTDLREPNWTKASRLDPNLYNPTDLDTDLWMDATKALGAKYAVFVAKWCTGHMQWQTDLYPYGLKQTKWRDGKGDVVKAFIESCRRADIKPGLYASVSANAYWEVNNPGLVGWGKGGDDAKQAEYARMSEKMLTELWGNYGPLFEVWFDGGALPPKDGGPDLLPILKKLQPQATVFGGPAETVRWIGNENGTAGYPCWATTGPGSGAETGDPNGTTWRPAECDVPIRNHEWFWNPNEDNKLYSRDDLIERYYQSVGRNGNLLIGLVVDRSGRIPKADLKRCLEFGNEVKRRFGQSVAETSGQGAIIELPLDKPRPIDHVILMEQIAQGERVREYVVEGMAQDQWRTLCQGQSIGHKRIERFAPAEVSKLRLRCTKSTATPIIRRLAAFAVDLH